MAKRTAGLLYAESWQNSLTCFLEQSLSKMEFSFSAKWGYWENSIVHTSIFPETKRFITKAFFMWEPGKRGNGWLP